jgi:hypothetical protein
MFSTSAAFSAASTSQGLPGLTDFPPICIENIDTLYTQTPSKATSLYVPIKLHMGES